MSNFTDTYIKNLKTLSARYEVYEGAGFGIRVSPSGAKSWIYRYKMLGKTEKITLGHYPSTSLANAKRLFLEYRELRKQGKNPRATIEHEKKCQDNTVKALVMSWVTGYVERSRKNAKQIRQQIDADIIPLLGDHQLDQLQTIQISQALDKIVSRGAPVHANRVLSTLKQVFNYGVSRGNMPINPAANIRAKDIGGAEKPRERFLTINEIKKLWLFLDSDDSKMMPHTKYAIKLILLTGVRTAELRLATWNEFDLVNSLWTIPGEHCKSGVGMKIHLSPQVKEILFELKKINDSGYVIYGVDHRQPLTESVLPRAITRIQGRLAIPKWRAHDLRRTFATQLGEALRIDPVVIEKCLGHKMPRIMATYNKNEMLAERKEALNEWGLYLERLIVEPNILPFSRVI
jgi:integrase